MNSPAGRPVVRARAGSWSAGLAAAALLAVGGVAVALAGAPVRTADLWWHLKMGEVYVDEGPWPAADPMLHTAHAKAPVQHEWLFSVATHAVERVAGFTGLRVVHASAVAAILVLAHVLLRREGAGREAAALATLAFAVLAWVRLMQLRPHLVSILAALAVYALLLARSTPPDWWRVGASTLLFLVWANVHPIFAVGLILIAAALLALAARAALSARLPAEARAAVRSVDRRRAVRLGAALVAGGLAGLLNPRGPAQHLDFHVASTTSGIWSVRDEWAPFHPFDWTGFGHEVSVSAGLVVDVLLAAVPLAAAIGLVRFLRRPSRARLEAVDPVRFSLAFAGLCALLISIRFFWMGAFGLLALLGLLRGTTRPGVGKTRALRPLLASACVALAGFHLLGVLRGPDARPLAHPRIYLETPYRTAGYHPAGVRFLRDAALSGRLFNSYVEGGFLGYWLAPRLRTFVDGRTDHFSTDVLEEYYDVKGLRPRRDGRDLLDLLERRGVDVFFGTGLPLARAPAWHVYTTAHLEGAPGWVLVFRAVDHALYVRDDARNRENLRRVAAYYAARGIPFDAARGLDVASAASANPEWAVAHQVLPLHWKRLEALRERGGPGQRYRALDEQALIFALLGEHERALRLDRAALELRPRALAPRRRLLHELLWLGRAREALPMARALRRRASDDPRHRALEAAAERLAGVGGSAPSATERRRILTQLPLLSEQEGREVLAGRFAEVRLERVASESGQTRSDSGAGRAASRTEQDDVTAGRTYPLDDGQERVSLELRDVAERRASLSGRRVRTQACGVAGRSRSCGLESRVVERAGGFTVGAA